MDLTYRLAAIALSLLSSSALIGQDIALSKLGQSVELDARAPDVNVAPAIPRPGHESVLCRFGISPESGSPTSYVLSGKIVSDNTGVGLERVALFVGMDGKAPSLAAMTNMDGEFKFRLWIKDNDRSSKLSVSDTSGFLYVGGHPSKTYRNRLRLMSGYSLRYQLKELADATGAKFEGPAKAPAAQPDAPPPIASQSGA